MSKKRKWQQASFFQDDSFFPDEPKTPQTRWGYGNPDEIRRRARQANHLHNWLESKQLELLGL